MSWLFLIEILIKFGPTIFSLVKEIIALIKLRHGSEQPELYGKLHTAVNLMSYHRKLGLMSAGASPLAALKAELLA